MKVIKNVFLTVFVIMIGLFVTTGCVKEKKEKEINLEEAELSLKSDSDSLRICEEKLTECE